jgi:ABC-type antimicrobial peptide transport system permease subunit
MGGVGVLRIRVRGDALQFAPVLRQVVHELHPDIAVTEERTLDAHINFMTATQRLSAFTTSALAVLGLALLAFGCLSLFLSMVKDSTREIAIRIALGADRLKLSRRIVGQGLLLISAGVLAGLVAGHFIAERVADQLYRIEPTDAVAFGGTAMFIIGIGLVSVYWSARVATRTDPAKYLRGE